MGQSKEKLDIQAPAEYADFIRAVAVPTALAETGAWRIRKVPSPWEER